ncbi:hypothetical protein AXF42_Ash000913 [Apostasia shenzhenica]|uniref:BAH domain-containing protein n=1 Tax=Apostasia shenzhenica TaxID=1088818 RepID=A0A2I0ATE7_9ASPA|nr:hypothetical protein AXF42_Ash000913 [Apostasia shenzhenica]
MGRRRLIAQVSSEDDEPDPSPPSDDRRRLKQRRLLGDKEEDDAVKDKSQHKANGRGAADGALEEESGEEEEEEAKAVPLGEVLKVTGKGKKRKNHYGSFEVDGNNFELDITEDVDGNLMVTGQWFYRPEEAERKGGGNWQAKDTRELFYSFHRDDVPAESVMHKCIVHFVPLHKKLPMRSQHPGFIVQKVYDTVERKLWKLTDKDYEDGKQHEIDVLVEKTRARIGELPDLEPGELSIDLHDQPNPTAQATQTTSKWNLRKKNPPPSIDAPRADVASTRFERTSKVETPSSCTADLSEYHEILNKFNALTGDLHRDKCLKRLLQAIQASCKDGDVAVDNLNESSNSKYNQDNKLAKRVLNEELEPSVVLTMTPDELREGLTAAERATKEPEETKQMQMTDARCTICSEKKVGVADIIHAGGQGDRYQWINRIIMDGWINLFGLECIACGHSWYASRDAISSLTIDTPSLTVNVGTAPLATSKFEEVEKKLISPRDTEKPAADLFLKSTMLETQKSFKSKPEDPPGAPTTMEQ